ncbi:hypothetical protein L1987_53343 [Smallanthus sonchifolius]|uniref:Uncharacterized protein n=1 Tax=Smallanthus sonchifolius TaxID=185202 RepID=A0ACB9EW09_9ASTR|nr:hypothetical protein L1987_53343 [Smallanthus sonchifolius]
MKIPHYWEYELTERNHVLRDRKGHRVLEALREDIPLQQMFKDEEEVREPAIMMRGFESRFVREEYDWDGGIRQVVDQRRPAEFRNWPSRDREMWDRQSREMEENMRY